MYMCVAKPLQRHSSERVGKSSCPKNSTHELVENHVDGSYVFWLQRDDRSGIRTTYLDGEQESSLEKLTQLKNVMLREEKSWIGRKNRFGSKVQVVHSNGQGGFPIRVSPLTGTLNSIVASQTTLKFSNNFL